LVFSPLKEATTLLKLGPAVLDGGYFSFLSKIDVK